MKSRERVASYIAKGFARTKAHVRQVHELYYHATLAMGNYYLSLTKGMDFHTEKEMEFPPEVGLWHERTSRRTFEQALRYVPSKGGRGFFDFGSGKGHALILAARHPFKRIGGVELSPRVHAVCQQNLKRHGLNSVELFHCNAKTLERELDEYDLFFLFNPFPPEVLSDVAHNLIASVGREHRQITIIYQNPMFHNELRKAGFKCYRVLNEGHRDRTRRVSLYTYS